MNAGLPGTGLGGLFYILLALAMPVRELYLTARGRSSRERWRTVGVQLAIAAGMVAALVGTQWGLARALDPRSTSTLGSAVVLAAGAGVGVAVLAVLAVTLRAWALVLGRTRLDT